MPISPSLIELEKITKSTHIPAISYAYVEPQKENVQDFTSTSITFGKKSSDANDDVDENTRFPASSLSKIVFTYLVLQLVDKNFITLDEPLLKLDESAQPILPYERFLVDGKYPEKALQLTARHVLSHTTGLPNWGPNLSSQLLFDEKSNLGEGYSYSGEAFLYLQKVIEAKMDKDLETLAKEYVFDPLQMNRSTFLPQPKNDPDVVTVHTQLGKPSPIYQCLPHLNAAASLLTTSHDFSKFLVAWLKKMDDPTFKQAFKQNSASDFMTCGLGWHIYKNENEVIAYQYGANPNTRSFVAINVNEKKAAAFFTNSENGLFIANEILSSPDLAPIGNMQELFEYKHWPQSDRPGWKETLRGMIEEDQGNFRQAKKAFEEAFELAPNDKSKKLRLKWFNKVHQDNSEKEEFNTPLSPFAGKYDNPHEEIELSIKNGELIYRQFDQEINLVRITDTDFLPAKDQSFKLRITDNQMKILSIDGWKKSLNKQPLLNSQLQFKDNMKQLRESGKAEDKETPKPSW